MPMNHDVWNGTDWKQTKPGGLHVQTPAGLKQVNKGFVWDGAAWRQHYQMAITPGACPSVRFTDLGSYPNKITLAWNAATDAASYNVYLAWTGQAKYLWKNVGAALSVVWDGIGSDTNCYMWVAAKSSDGTEGPHSAQMGFNSGHPQQKKTGSLTHESRPWATCTWRNDGNGWSYNGDDVLQGWYSNQAWNAYGGIHVDGDAVMNWVAQNYGSDVPSHLNFTDLAIMVYRTSGTGTGSSVSQTYYVSSAVPGQTSGQPSLAGGTAMGSHAPNNAGTWDRGLPPHWAGHVMRHEDVPGTGPCHSFIIMRDNSTDYSRYHGKGDAGNAFNIYIAANWDFVTVNQQNTYAI